MGNECGHPEWIDFPREGNNWGYKYCRRRWDLCDDPTLKFKLLNVHFVIKNFDKAMIHLEITFNFMVSKNVYISEKHEVPHFNQENKVIVFEKGCLLFVFNFH